MTAKNMTAKKKAPGASKRSTAKETTKKTMEKAPNIKDLLLNGPKFEMILPKRIQWRRRSPIRFE